MNLVIGSWNEFGYWQLKDDQINLEVGLYMKIAVSNTFIP